MQKHHLKYATIEVPRYTSYPTAAQFGELVGRPTTIVLGYDRVGAYFKALMREVELLGAAIGFKPTISHLHFGGGTPTILSPEHFGKFVARIKEHFTFLPVADLAVEMDPRTLTPEMVGALAKAAGYEEIGFDHYARPDDAMSIASRRGSLKRNFQGYTVDEADIMLGLGASSIGQIQQGYVQNATNLKEWCEIVEIVESGKLTVLRGLAINDEDRFRRSAIEKVMTDLALDIEAHCQEYDKQPDALDDALDKLKGCAADGLIEPEGRHFLRSIAASFDRYWKPSKSKHSIAV